MFLTYILVRLGPVIIIPSKFSTMFSGIRTSLTWLWWFGFRLLQKQLRTSKVARKFSSLYLYQIPVFNLDPWCTMYLEEDHLRDKLVRMKLRLQIEIRTRNPFWFRRRPLLHLQLEKISVIYNSRGFSVYDVTNI